MKSSADPCVFVEKNKRLYLALYVDDGLLCGTNVSEMNVLLNDLHIEFKITYSKAEFFVGLQIERSRDEGQLKIHQSTYTEEILKRFNHEKCDPVSTPAEPGIKLSKVGKSVEENIIFPYRQAIGSLMYLMVGSRPDIIYIVGMLSRFMEQPRLEHWNAVRRVLKYLRGTTNYGITFSCNLQDARLVAYSDADFAGDIDKRLTLVLLVGLVLLIQDQYHGDQLNRLLLQRQQQNRNL